MSEKPQVPAIEGWYSMNAENPRLLGSRCTDCGTWFFPRLAGYCRNPACDGEAFEEAELSHTGKLWSYTNACYQPPAPFVAAEPFEPFALAAMELERERMVVLGQVAAGFGVEDLKVGMAMELALETLHETDEDRRMIWKWRPLQGKQL